MTPLNSMPQTLSLSNPPRNPFTEVKLKNSFYKDDGRLMCFGEFICPESGKYTDTIINSFVKGNDEVLELIYEGDVVHTTQPRENQGTNAKVGQTRYRVNLRDIDEQPIYLQERWREFVEKEELENKSESNEKSNSFGVMLSAASNEKEAALAYTTKKATNFNNKPNTIMLQKTVLRFKYMDKLVAVSPFAPTDRSRYSKTLGDLVDFCIEQGINPYEQ